MGSDGRTRRESHKFWPFSGGRGESANRGAFSTLFQSTLDTLPSQGWRRAFHPCILAPRRRHSARPELRRLELELVVHARRKAWHAGGRSHHVGWLNHRLARWAKRL